MRDCPLCTTTYCPLRLSSVLHALVCAPIRSICCVATFDTSTAISVVLCKSGLIDGIVLKGGLHPHARCFGYGGHAGYASTDCNRCVRLDSAAWHGYNTGQRLNMLYGLVPNRDNPMSLLLTVVT